MNRVLNVPTLSIKEKFEFQRTFLGRLRKYKTMPSPKQLSQGEVASVEDKDGSFLVVKQGKKLVKYTGTEVG